MTGMIVVCGVAGAGKTTVGKLLSEKLGVPFYDADDFHPESNIEKMGNGRPLFDEDRQPWLETLAARMGDWEKEGGGVLACSALKELYRETLASGCEEDLRWVFLTGTEATLAKRLASRQGHFFDRNLLGTQLSALEIPDYGWQVDVEASPEEIVDSILERLRSA